MKLVSYNIQYGLGKDVRYQKKGNHNNAANC